MAWQTPITDWDGVTENPNRKWFNFGDLNRIENNTDALADLIETYADRPNLDDIVTDRTNISIDFYDDLNRIEDNILIIKNASYEPAGWEAPVTNWKTLDPFDYNDANRLENNLLRLYVLINNIINYFQYCGTFTCGQDNTYL